MDQRLSLVTLGVADVDRARGFYEALGWRAAERPDSDDVVFFQAGCLVVALWGRDRLAEELQWRTRGAGAASPSLTTWRARSRSTRPWLQPGAAGATVTRPPAATCWGGYSGVFADVDGHPWEVAHNPFWTLASDGSVRVDA